MSTLDVILILAAAGCWAGTSLVALGARDDRPGILLGMAGALLASAGALHVLLGGAPSRLDGTFWGVPARLEVDALSAAFLLPLQVVAALGALYGREYWPLAAPKGSGRALRFFFGTLAGAMTLLFLARQGLLFLLAWEAMAVSAFFLVSTEHGKPEVRRAGWVYLACTHTGTLLLTAMVILLARRLGGLLWVPLPPGPPAVLDGWILLLAVAGFGFKAGLFPLHFWLPPAHAAAPSHVSAILSGVMLKTGIYGLLRVSGLLPSVPRGVGGALLALGSLTAVYGVGNALAQRDYKRLLAYSSVENLGIVAMGVGLGWTGRATGDPWLAALGFGGAIFHVWNHALFKSLLFLGSGSVLHATGTRDMEQLGGLGRRMPRTALFLAPALLAVAALPPLGAFLSEWFLYRGLFASLHRGYPWSAGLALVALAFTGGLAAVAFARFYGILFLGQPRGAAAAHAHDPGSAMLAPMAFLAALCLVAGLAAPLLPPLLARAAAPAGLALPGVLAAGLTRDLRILLGLELLLLALGAGALAWLRRRPASALAPPTWDCGYGHGTARMQYTGSSFADPWAALLPGLRTRMRRLKGLFPRPQAFRSEHQDAVGEGLVAPWIGRLAARALRLRRLQPGYLSIYILYVLVTLLAVFLWPLLRERLLG
ncbi:MAG TPA: proton-conducting transporter membrane subunit [Holophagaceae bacterium]